MDMTPEQLRYLRDERGLTREALADELGDCTASTINKWERGINPIPAWVADKMFAKMPVSFTIQELAEMYDLCREEAMGMSELIQEAVRSKLEQRRASQTPPATKFAQFPAQQPSSPVAEDPRDQHKAKDGTND